MKTKDIYLTIERRNKILTSLHTISSIKHDKITLSITLKILGIQMFEYLSEEDYQEHLRQEKARGSLEERLKRKIEFDTKKAELINQQIEEERKKLEALENQQRQNLLNIQTDIKLKFDSNELSLTEEAKKQIQLKKEVETISEVVPPTKSRKKTITLKEGYLKWLEKKKNIDKVGNSSFKTYQSGYKYLTLLIDENRTIDTIEPYEISDLQNLLTQLPKNTFTYNKFKDKTLEEILELIDEDENEFSLLTNDTINNHCNNYSNMFDYFWKQNYIDTNPVRLDSLAKNETIKLSFDDEDIVKIMNEIEEEGLKHLFKIALYSGLRISEILLMKKTDIIEGNLFSIQEGKTKNSIREVYIHEQIKDLVEYYLKNNESDYLIFNGEINAITKRVNRNIKKIVGDNRKTFHSTRHNFIERISDNKNSDKIDRMKISGHSLSKEDKLHLERYGHYSFKKKRNENKDIVSFVKYDCLEK
ncbi:MAG: tyrosine-type recombinase/integrase [Sulfuricurvum sp.]|nr:tyrosine-type recombinase/integrase [Sulfuricurvum sp.]MDP3023374.1 tyrosine-type recombinase/integrase [Sulfuricurvum sp.]MDP3119479.1 tyrosine-type recombinase/integrase [Sulfuricurvum sp.]